MSEDTNTQAEQEFIEGLKQVEESLGNTVTVEEALVKADPSPPEVPVQPQVDEILAALLGKIQTIDNVSDKLKVLVYSDPDGGKSTFGTTATNSLIIDADRGLTSVRNTPELLGRNVKVYPYKSFQGFEILVNYLAMDNPAFDDTEVVVIDTLSELHKKGLAETTERDYALNPAANNRYRAETEQHTENNEHIRRIVSTLKDLDRHVIILAHSRLVEPKNKPAKIYPDFSEKLAKSIVALMDICVYIEKVEVNGEVQRVFRFHTEDSIMTKCRIGGMPTEAVNVTWDSLMAKFQEHLANTSKSQ